MLVACLPELTRPTEVVLSKSLPLLGIQQMLLYDCLHKRHMPRGLGISQRFYQAVVQ